MSVRGKILEVMYGKEPLTAKRISESCGLDSSTVSKALNSMAASEIVHEVSNTTIRGRKLYKLKDISYIPRGAVRDFVKENPGCTLQQVIDGIGCRKQTAREYITNAIRNGKMIKGCNSSGEQTYTMEESKLTRFGCANPLTMIFNQRITLARLNK